MYFNLGIATPKFLQSDEMIFKLIRLYEKGFLTFNLKNDSIKLDFAAVGINETKTRAYPGYPKNAIDGILSNLVCTDIVNSKLEELIYINSEKRLVIADINNQELSQHTIKINDNIEYTPIVLDFNKDGKKEIVYLTQSGELYIFDEKGSFLKGIQYQQELKIILNRSFITTD